MSKLSTPLPSLRGARARAALVGCLLALVSPAATGADFAPLNTRPEMLGELDVHRHVPGISAEAPLTAGGLEQAGADGLYRQVGRHFKFRLRYARAVFSPAPAEAPDDDHYVFLNLVGML